MADMKTIKKGAKAVGAVAAGAALGFATGVLVAPASGAETRRRIARRAEDAALNARGAARQAAKDVGNAAAQVVARVRPRAV
jgi:gas vesicle protein